MRARMNMKSVAEFYLDCVAKILKKTLGVVPAVTQHHKIPPGIIVKPQADI